MHNSCFYKSIKVLPILCRSFYFKMTGTSCTYMYDARVKVPSFQKVTFFLQYEIFHRDAIHLYFCLMKVFLTAAIKVEHASNDLLQSDCSFLLRYNMKTSTTSSEIIAIHFYACNLQFRKFAPFCTPYYLRHGIDFFQRLFITTSRVCSS